MGPACADLRRLNIGRDPAEVGRSSSQNSMIGFILRASAPLKLSSTMPVNPRVVVFQDTSDDLFCDRQVDVGHDIVIGSEGVPLSVHRALKGQHHIIEKVRQAWNTHKDRLRGIAILGAHLSSQFNKNRRFNYNDKELIEAFDRAVASYNGFTQP